MRENIRLDRVIDTQPRGLPSSAASTAIDVSMTRLLTTSLLIIIQPLDVCDEFLGKRRVAKLTMVCRKRIKQLARFA